MGKLKLCERSSQLRICRTGKVSVAGDGARLDGNSAAMLGSKGAHEAGKG